MVVGITGPQGPPGFSGINRSREEAGVPGPNYVLESKVEDVVYYRDRKVMDQPPGECIFGLLLDLPKSSLGNARLLLTVSFLHVYLHDIMPEFSRLLFHLGLPSLLQLNTHILYKQLGILAITVA